MFIINTIIFDSLFVITDNFILHHLLTNQITYLNIDIKEKTENGSKIGSKIFAKILSLCKNLVALNFCHMFLARNYSPSLSYLQQERCISSTLIKLKINVPTLLDCLNLLDGPLVCLSTLIINVSYTFYPSDYINPPVNIISMIIFT